MRISQDDSLNPELRPLDESNQELESDVKEVDDILLQAGITFSTQQIYQREYDLPMDNRGRYYQAQPVDDLLVMMNDIFKRLAKQAVFDRQSAAVTRETVEAFKKSRRDDRHKIAEVQADLDAEQEVNQHLKQKQVQFEALVKHNHQLRKVGLALKKVVAGQQQTQSQMKTQYENELQQKQAQIDQLLAEKQTLNDENQSNQQSVQDTQAQLVQQKEMNQQLMDQIERANQQLKQLEPKYQTLLYKYQQLQLATHSQSVDDD